VKFHAHQKGYILIVIEPHLMLIALSGTPGVGKTTVSKLLSAKGYKILQIETLADDNGFVTGMDEETNSKIIDIEGLDEFVSHKYKDGEYIIEGHLSHLLSVDYVVILRCDPLILKQRLKEKGWSSKKINENIGAEILDVIKVEAYEVLEKVYEIDTTSKSPEEVAVAIEDIFKGIYEEPEITWLEKYDYLLLD
jgi:adenylate kinase